MSIRHISPLFEKVKFRAQAFGGDLGERAIEVVNLFAKARGVRWIRKKALAIDYREDRIKDTPLRLAIRLQKGVAIIEALTEVAAHLGGGKPLIVVLTEVRIARIALDSDNALETGLDEIEGSMISRKRGSCFLKNCVMPRMQAAAEAVSPRRKSEFATMTLSRTQTFW